MLSLLLFGLRSLLVSATADEDDGDDGVVEDELPRNPFPDGKMPSAEELLKMLDSMGGLSDEDKEALRRDLLKKAQGGFVDDDLVADEQHIATSFFASQFFILVVMLAVITLIFVFFGYKLYSSLSERERKREEKRKNRQLKKKK
ncbi:uncharacterized protein LOC131665641 [Phymastichus coffea]|uniref:uncharacterized protein LOC131665641 n=1 Tax=Phymastichus coffea TaxID=108790 RepID=UPI00273B0258|nr:uncharacterized protein LOC131665641 [Phymastichus coffea]XP_058793663.1 uncharacterized protein LOC131665641 [Phymastichus coffea]